MNELTGLIWLMRYTWRMDGEDHVRIYPDGRVQVLRYKPIQTKDDIIEQYQILAEFQSISQLAKQLNGDTDRDMEGD